MQPTAQADVPVRQTDASLLAEALHELSRAVHKTTIYPPEHPEVEAAIRRSSESLTAALAAGARLVVGVSKDHLLLEREPFEPSLGPLRSLARTLHDLDVAAIEISPPVRAEDLRRLVVHVAASRREGNGKPLAERLREDAPAGIRVAFLDYRGLSFSPWDERVAPAGEAGDVWDRLITTLTDPGTYQSAGIAAGALAEETNRRLGRPRSQDVAPLRRRMHALTRRIEAMTDAQREALQARLAGFVSALSPELRRELLRVDPGEAESVTLVTELAEGLPDPVLLDVLRDIDRQGDKVPGHFLTFLSKVARVSSEQSSVGGELQDVLGRWGVSKKALAGDAGALRSALEQVFRRRLDATFNPDSYQRLLEDLANREVPPSTRKVFERYRDPRDPVEVQAQVAEIAIRLLEEDGGAEGRAGLIGYLGAATDQLLEAAQYHSVRDAAVAAKRLCERPGEDEETRLAATGYLKDLTAEERIDRLLHRACRGEQVPKAVAALLALGGARSLERILDFLDESPTPRVAAMLEKLAARMGARPLAEILMARWPGGWARLRPTFRIIRGLPPRDAVATLERLLEHAETRVRREAVTALCEIDRRAGAADRHLERALRDEDPRLVVFAIQQLFARARPESIELLGAFVEGSLGGSVPGPAFVRRAAQGMVALGSRGRRRLCQSLECLRARLRPRAARAGGLVHEILHAHRDDPEVRRVLTRWRYSPAGLLALATARRVSAPEEDEE